jgi:ribulose-phosphate 3-epimerase
MTIIAPSILSADFARLGEAAGRIAASGADWVHLDVMDGVFVPPITFGAKAVADLRKLSALPFDVHLMTSSPEKQIEDFARAGADFITFHAETALHANRLAAEIRRLDRKAGVSIVPSTPVSALESLLPFIDLVLVMTVNPGYGGQKCIPECFKKVAQLSRMREKLGGGFLISADGGINAETGRMATDAGADILVTGSAFFDSDDKAAFVRGLRA